MLEDIAGEAVTGYRAPSFSIGPGNAWAHDLIAETGHRYSSSVYPVAHDHYGTPDAPRFAHRLRNGLLEIPPSTVRWGGRNWPVGGGGYFRLLPYRVSAWGIRRVNVVDARPAMVYFHPWEFDPEQPRVRDASAKARFRHYLNLRPHRDTHPASAARVQLAACRPGLRRRTRAGVPAHRAMAANAPMRAAPTPRGLAA